MTFRAPELPPVLFREAGEGEDLGTGLVQECGRFGEATLKLGDDASMLGRAPSRRPAARRLNAPSSPRMTARFLAHA